MRRREFLTTIAGGTAFALTRGVVNADDNLAGPQPGKGGDAMSKQIDDWCGTEANTITKRGETHGAQTGF